MLKKILFVLSLCISQTSFADDFSDGLKMMGSGKSQEAFIQKFAETAKTKDSPGIIAMVYPASIPPNNEALHMWLNSEVFPFFEQYSKLHNYKQITKAVLPDGTTGLWHYMFIINDKEKVVPFRIAVINTENGPKILDFVANECVKGRHPFCP